MKKSSCDEYEEKVRVCISEIVRLTQQHKKHHTKDPEFDEREYIVTQATRILQVLFSDMRLYLGEVIFLVEFLKLKNFLLKTESPVPHLFISPLTSRQMKPGVKIRKAPEALYG